MLMPFGKYRGRALTALPDGYFEWLRGLDDLRPPLRQALEAEAERRGRSTPSGNGVPALSFVEDLISAGRRALAARHHPDRGGSTGTMQAVNNAADWLLTEARRLWS